MATNGNNLEPAFEALLKSHVQQQGTRAAADCAQFDPDTANAYLEQLLTPTALATYEYHLADCSVCRRHLAQLAQLMPTPALVVNPVSPTAVLSLRERLSGWWTNWRLGALIGVGAVTATALLLVVVVNRSSQQGAMVASRDQVASAPVPAATLAPSATPTPFAEANGNASAATGVAAPAPLAEQMKARAVVATTPAPPAEFKATADAAAPPPPPPPKLEVPASPGPQGQQGQQGQQDAVAKQAPLPDQGARAQNQLRNVQLPLKGPADIQLERSERARVEPATPAPGAAPAKVEERATEKERASGLAAATSRAAEVTDKKTSEADDARSPAKLKRPTAAMKPTPPARRTVGTKTFQLQNGLWIDTAYDVAANLPLVRLQTNSDAYQQTLESLPALKPYFDLAPVLVVWQGKAYRVERK